MSGAREWITLIEAARIIGRFPSNTRRVLEGAGVRWRPILAGSNRVLWHRADVEALAEVPVYRGPRSNPELASASA